MLCLQQTSCNKQVLPEKLRSVGRKKTPAIAEVSCARDWTCLRQAGSNQHTLSGATTSKWCVYQPACRQAGFDSPMKNYRDFINSLPTPDFRYFSRCLA